MKFITIFLLLLIGSPLSKSDSPIKNVIVLVMENRSFDHMLGWMKALNPAINGVDGSETNPESTTDPKSPLVNFKDQAHYVDPDPGHSFQEIREQIFGSDNTSADPAPMNGFVQQARSLGGNMTDAVMNGFKPDKVAVYKELVSQFAVFDRWFASVPASTQPNRLYVHSGTSHGVVFLMNAVVHGPNGKPTASSEYEHSSIPATVKKIFNLKAPFLTKRDAWAGTFEGILQTRTTPRTDCPEALPMPVKIRQSEANEEAQLTEFQQELVQLGSVINGDYPHIPDFFTRVIPKMNVREGSNYMRNGIKRFLEAGHAAIKLGVDGERIVKMRPSLTSRTKSTNQT